MRTNPLGFFIKCGFALQDTGIDVQIGWHVDNVWGYHEDFHFILVIARTFTSHLNDTLFEDNNDKGDWVVVSALIKILTTPRNYEAAASAVVECWEFEELGECLQFLATTTSNRRLSWLRLIPSHKTNAIPLNFVSRLTQHAADVTHLTLPSFY